MYTKYKLQYTLPKNGQVVVNQCTYVYKIQITIHSSQELSKPGITLVNNNINKTVHSDSPECFRMAGLDVKWCILISTETETIFQFLLLRFISGVTLDQLDGFHETEGLFQYKITVKMFLEGCWKGNYRGLSLTKICIHAQDQIYII